jgi:DUF1680 family protein
MMRTAVPPPRWKLAAGTAATIAAHGALAGTSAAPAAAGGTLSLFPLNAVRLGPGPFLEAQQTDLRYILSLDADRLLAPFLREAGLPPKQPSYGNWESSGLDGHMGGHYLSALALMYASTGNQQVLAA